jgi:hypothetical protein
VSQEQADSGIPLQQQEPKARRGNHDIEPIQLTFEVYSPPEPVRMAANSDQLPPMELASGHVADLRAYDRCLCPRHRHRMLEGTWRCPNCRDGILHWLKNSLLNLFTYAEE